MLMAKDTGKCADDLMTVTVEFSFQGKTAPLPPGADPEDMPAIDGSVEYALTLPAEDATADYLEKIAKAIRERRLYGFMQQECADAHVAGGQWIQKSIDDLTREIRAPCGVVSIKQ